MPNRANDWLLQAERNLKQAQDSFEDGNYEWVCFASHQASEMAVKALHLFYNQEAWGHTISKLLNELPEEIKVPADLIEKAKVLDGYYIPPRYPNSFPEGAPFEHFGKIQAKEAISYASEIFKFVNSKMA